MSQCFKTIPKTLTQEQPGGPPPRVEDLGKIAFLARGPALTGTLVANSKGGSNCYGVISEKDGYNLDSGTSCGFKKHPLNNTDPLLGPLGNNGGPTWTMAL